MTRSRNVTPQGEALNELLYEVAFAYFRIQATADGRAGGRRLTLGQISLLRSLAQGGAQTVPEIARSRPVARQPVQRMADELAAGGLVAFVDNPRHRRSKLVQLTARGRRLQAEIERAQVAWASRVAGGDLSEKGLRQATRTLRRVGERLLDCVESGRVQGRG